VPEEPARLGEYSLLEKLGQGGMAMVYRGERSGEAGFKKKVALKRMLPAYRRDPSLLERFAAEARTNARLDHPNLVQVVDFGIDPEPFLVMEFVDGVTLAALLQRLVDRREKLEIAAACFIGAEAAQGLDYAHRKRDEHGAPLGIVHRDVSPQNVLLSNEGAVKVSDFGLVKAADNVVQTGSGIPIGKMSYMAPEQASHAPIDARADVFSIGIVVWEMLTMRTLLPPHDPARSSQLLKRCDFRRPSSINPKVSPRLDEIVMRCLTKDAEERTPSAQALSMQLREVLHELAPGYGREQLARLVGWAFPERGWIIDEPHETAAQPSPAERSSMPQVPAAEAMQRVSRTGPNPASSEVRTAPSPHMEKPSGSALGFWLLLIGGACLIGLVLLIGLLGFAFFLSSDEADGESQPPIAVPVAPSVAQPQVASIWIDANAPGTRIFVGSIELGLAPVQLGVDRLNGDPIVAIAPSFAPTIVESARVTQLIAEGRIREQVTLQPARRPSRVLLVRWPRQARVRTAFTNEELGTVPGIVIAPDQSNGLAALIEVVEPDRAAVRISTANCDPLGVCVLEGGAL
jgi:eukaryotic-like serine/threonine-protein kinase